MKERQGERHWLITQTGLSFYEDERQRQRERETERDIDYCMPYNPIILYRWDKDRYRETKSLHIYYLIYNGVAAYKKMRKKDIFIYICKKMPFSIYRERHKQKEQRYKERV